MKYLLLSLFLIGCETDEEYDTRHQIYLNKLIVWCKQECMDNGAINYSIVYKWNRHGECGCVYNLSNKIQPGK